MLREYETRLPRNSEGWCLGYDVWCNYCDRCDYLFKCWREVQRKKKLPDDKLIFMRRNREYAIKAERRRNEIEREMRLNITGDIPHWFVTATFPKDHPPGDAHAKMEKCCRSYDLDGGIAGIEFHSDKAPDGGHLHFHILAPKSKKYKPSTLIKQVAKICDISTNFVDIGKNNNFTTRVNYICGLKQDSKVDYCAKDRVWRDEMGFPRIYLDFTSALRDKYKMQIDFVNA